jgi:NADPH2:quinone reductase
VFWGSFIARDLARHRANAARILDAVADGRLRPHVDATLPFDRAGEALARLERREVLGKLVLVP